MFKKLMLICVLVSNFSILLKADTKALNINKNVTKYPKNILKKIDDLRTPQESFFIDVEVIVFNGKKKNRFSLTVGSKHGRSFAIYKLPRRHRGQTILSIKKNIWLYFPGTSNPFRISPQQKILGQASAIDILSLQLDKNYSIHTYKEIKENLILKLKSTNQNITYDLVDLTVNKQSLMLKQLDCFAMSGKHLKTVYISDVKKLAGKKRPSKFTIVDSLNKNLKSVILYKQVYLKNIPDKHFSKNYIKELAKQYLSKKY